MSQQPYYYAGNQPVVVVQGQEVPSKTTTPTVQASTYSHGQGNQQQLLNQQRQAPPKRCNDVFFAILFYAHLGVIAWCTATYSQAMYSSIADQYNGNRRLGAFGRFLQEDDGQAQEDNNDGGFVLTMNEVLSVLLITGLVGFTISTLALGFMMRFASALIKVALIFNVVLNFVVGLAALAAGATPLAIVCFLSFAMMVCYAYAVWNRIPFAAANMVTAITAVRTNFGLSFFAYLALLMTFGWSIWWSLAAVSTSFVTNGCNAQGECESASNGVVVFLFFVSYFWTAQVIKNTVHVTVAGTVGTWWFVPREASSCCSKAISDSWFRSMTTSFGSICFGSLVVAIIQAVKEMVRQARHQDDSIILSCAECLLGCIESLAEYFNQWAYVFVGLYGFSFMEAGSNVMTLFRSRGWTAIIADMLVDSVLTMVSVGVGVLNGLVGLLVLRGIAGDVGNEAMVGAFL